MRKGSTRGPDWESEISRERMVVLAPKPLPPSSCHSYLILLLFLSKCISSEMPVTALHAFPLLFLSPLFPAASPANLSQAAEREREGRMRGSRNGVPVTLAATTPCLFCDYCPCFVAAFTDWQTRGAAEEGEREKEKRKTKCVGERMDLDDDSGEGRERRCILSADACLSLSLV